MTRPDDARRIRGRIRAEIREHAARLLEIHGLGALTRVVPTPEWYPFANREHARLVAALRTGRAIGPLTGKTRR